MTPAEYIYSEEDVAVIRSQIGRENVFISGLMERCIYGYPRIMLLDSDAGNGKLNYEALSNVFWLTCPFLNEKIHDLEQAGYIDEIADFIGQDAAFATMMSNAHAHMYFFRKRTYNVPIDKTVPPDIRRVMDAGVGGARYTNSLKCLHAHFCHYRICPDNVAGLITARLLNDRIDCEEVRCRNAV